MYGHFGPKKLWTQDCVWCRSVSYFALVPKSAPVPKCRRQFGTKAHETLQTWN